MRLWALWDSNPVAAVRETAAASGSGRLWLTTTNDNLHAPRFYPTRGFRLAVLYPDAVKHTRALKPENLRDRHRWLAIDDGTNTAEGGGGFPVFQAAALDRPGPTARARSPAPAFEGRDV